mgnify:CR=1 FL=1
MCEAQDLRETAVDLEVDAGAAGARMDDDVVDQAAQRRLRFHPVFLGPLERGAELGDALAATVDLAVQFIGDWGMPA